MTPARPKDTGTWDVNTTIALSALEICKKLYFVKLSQNWFSTRCQNVFSRKSVTVCENLVCNAFPMSLKWRF